jgi:hypothetical protein
VAGTGRDVGGTETGLRERRERCRNLRYLSAVGGENGRGGLQRNRVVKGAFEKNNEETQENMGLNQYIDKMRMFLPLGKQAKT